MKPVKNAITKPTTAGASQRPAKKAKPKILSPAKKFRLRLRRAKFQKQQQAKDDYYEHDNRDMAKAAAAAAGEKKKAKRLSKKGRRAQMYIDAYLKSQHVNQNGDTASQDETQDSSNGNEVSLKSIVHRASVGLPPMTSHMSHAFRKEQATQKGRKLSTASASFPTTASLAGNTSTIKCCCHCACSSGKKKKPRRKLSSPYFGDFNRTLSLPNGSCAREAAALTTKFLNQTTTTTHHHHETLVKAGEFVALSATASMKHRHLVPAFERNFTVRGRSGSDVREMRSVVRFVIRLSDSFGGEKSFLMRKNP